ncbi:Protein-arginine kinase activator protein McsA [Candidatus Syntrophocurvum alkaliphilum]|uniref:Protein-arginine kinase activator protein McsA n=1 Tax=Candidatus Syntrophocurvum alkaliphilum TaxID=2293317 RepID=A0A6I6DIS1_9FIRM|nr:UvrB/UvrC motif-containing protein [Candidatus Syntrophocurvum alkaliphilum]QGU00744.1 Protein-arginine kinase activator protein McsA [Candidatus Syntrophocurvum alkaliphilum]
MYCEECKKNVATVHLTQMINGEKTENHLCEKCAAKKGGFLFNPDDHQLSVQNLLSGFFGSTHNVSDLKALPNQKNNCDNCNVSLVDIQKHGRLGCSECYSVFEQQLAHTLRRIHGNSKHVGKIPARGGEKVLIQKKIDRLKSNLQKAITNEEYEKAAEIRDSIKDLEKELE